MTKAEFDLFAEEFHQKVVTIVKIMMALGKVTLTKSAEASLKEGIGLQTTDQLPNEIFKYEPKSVEPQVSLDSDQVLSLVCISIPRLIGGQLVYDRANSSDFKCIVRIMHNNILIISAMPVSTFKRISLQNMIIEQMSKLEKAQCDPTAGSPQLDQMLVELLQSKLKLQPQHRTHEVELKRTEDLQQLKG